MRKWVRLHSYLNKYINVISQRVNPSPTKSEFQNYPPKFPSLSSTTKATASPICRLAAEFSSVWLQILLWRILYNNNNNITQYYKQIKYLSVRSVTFIGSRNPITNFFKKKKTFASSFMFWFFSRSKPAWIGSSVASSNSAEKSAAVPSVKSISVSFFCFFKRICI